jgi:hypothetical protein
MLAIHLYGKLRRFAADSAPTAASVVTMQHEEGDTVSSVVQRIGVPPGELGSNLFVNGRYASPGSPVSDGDRLGLFPDDMQLLYKWYFAPSSGSAAPNLSTEDPASGSGRSKSGTEEHGN